MSTRAIIGIIVLFLVIAGGIFFITRGGTQKSEDVFTPSGIELNKPSESTTTNPTSESDTVVQGACVPKGCHQELCVDEGVMVKASCATEPYALLEESCLTQYAFCERQKSGQCGWSTTDKYNQCMVEISEK